MGGNVDYTGGSVFEATIREATWAAAQLRSDRILALVNPQMEDSQWQARVEVSLDDLTSDAAVRTIVNRTPGVRWTAYVLGVLPSAATSLARTSAIRLDALSAF